MESQKNYRSTQPALDLANALMRQMSRSFRKRLFTHRQDGEPPLLVEAGNEREQARWMAAETTRSPSSSSWGVSRSRT